LFDEPEDGGRSTLSNAVLSLRQWAVSKVAVTIVAVIAIYNNYEVYSTL
jgi:hypothetical protein